MSAQQSQRQRRVGELIRHELSSILQRGEVADPVLESHVVTISEVRLSPDLKIATAYVMPLGGRDVRAVVKALAANRRHLRGLIARRVKLKFTPDLRFLADETFDRAAETERLLHLPEVARDLESRDDE
ncbi:MAG: 30S ribosome-binding factor RbfA [Flavobacteriaceae bacterium]